MPRRSKLREPSVPAAGSLRTREVTSPDDEHPVFSLRYLQDDFGLRHCTREEKAALIDTLYRLSQLTWAQLRLAPRHGLGYERIASRAIRAPNPHGVTEDVAYIAFRFHGLAPMVGYRTGAISISSGSTAPSPSTIMASGSPGTARTPMRLGARYRSPA
jgi:hypothetical protein